MSVLRTFTGCASSHFIPPHLSNTIYQHTRPRPLERGEGGQTADQGGSYTHGGCTMFIPWYANHGLPVARALDWIHAVFVSTWAQSPPFVLVLLAFGMTVPCEECRTHTGPTTMVKEHNAISALGLLLQNTCRLSKDAVTLRFCSGKSSFRSGGWVGGWLRTTPPKLPPRASCTTH